MVQHRKALKRYDSMKRYDSGIGIDSQLILTDLKIEVKLLLVVRRSKLSCCYGEKTRSGSLAVPRVYAILRVSYVQEVHI